MEITEDISGLTVDDDGNVTALTGDVKQILTELIQHFKEVGGSVTSSLISQEIEKRQTMTLSFLMYSIVRTKQKDLYHPSNQNRLVKTVNILH